MATISFEVSDEVVAPAVGMRSPVDSEGPMGERRWSIGQPVQKDGIRGVIVGVRRSPYQVTVLTVRTDDGSEVLWDAPIGVGRD